MKTISIILLSLLLLTALWAEENEYRPSDQSVLILPTAYTIPAGTITFTDYEILILHFTYSPMDRLHLGLMFPFPAVKEFVDYITPGFKYTYFISETLNMAVGGSYTNYYNAHSLNHIVSIGKPDKSVHLMLGWADADNSKSNLIFGVGYRAALKPSTSFLGELITTQRILEKDPDALLMLGLRFHGKKVSWDLGGARAIGETDSELWLIPFLKTTVILN
ncbi:MAG: hypothetical protein FJ042_04380 [Candidatus Cloacimonetes bacterium]|nr:hypothetical protein [Candidatus Cloacimonadota bacterium]